MILKNPIAFFLVLLTAFSFVPDNKDVNRVIALTHGLVITAGDTGSEDSGTTHMPFEENEGEEDSETFSERDSEDDHADLPAIIGCTLFCYGFDFSVVSTIDLAAFDLSDFYSVNEIFLSVRNIRV